MRRVLSSELRRGPVLHGRRRGEMTEITAVVPGGAELGEGPIWDPRDRLLYWVNILAGEIHRFDPASGRDEVCIVPEPVGSLAIRERGGLVAALGRGFGFVDFATATVRTIGEVEPDKPDNRM